MLYAGIDVHKEHCQAVIMTKDGDIVKEGRFPTNKCAYKEFFSGFKDLSVTFETVANYNFHYSLLRDLGFTVDVANPVKVRLIADAKIKTDKIDAKVLADLLRTNMLPTSYVPSDDIRELRFIVRHRVALGQHRAKLKVQIHQELYKENLSCPLGKESTFSKKGIEWLRRLKKPNINSFLNIYEIVERQVYEAHKQITTEGMKYEGVRLLETIPGIGVYSASLIYSEIGDINRFPSEEKLFAYAGLVPRIHQSGGNEYRGGITKQGSKYLRWILTEAVYTHIRYAPDSKLSTFHSRLQKRKPKNVATMATARKLLQVCYHMLKNHTEYRG